MESCKRRSHKMRYNCQEKEGININENKLNTLESINKVLSDIMFAINNQNK